MRYEVVCQPGSPDRLNEDAVFLHVTDQFVVGAVIDGATERLPSNALLPLLEQDNGRLTAAALAAQVTRDALPNVVDLSPRDMLIAANEALRAQMEPYYGQLTPEAVFTREPILTDYRHDMRLMRMVLPVCVATVIKIDLTTNQLSFANLGDTSLLLFGRDGVVELAAGDNGRVSSRSVLGRAREIQRQRGVASFRELIRDPDVVGQNLEGALYHNYVDEQGQPDPSQGIGVVNGLPEAAAFIQAGSHPLSDLDGILLITDGMMWPTEKIDETPPEVLQRLSQMRQTIQSNGLEEYYQALHQAQEEDSDLNQFPRFKIHDDATGILIFI